MSRSLARVRAVVSQGSPIGVFDSGVGGLTVVRALRQALPGEHILYLGDTARVPYGNKSPATVEKYALGCAKFLLDRGVKLLLVACNTASAHALTTLEATLPVPVIGAVGPGATTAHAASKSGHIGVIGTLGTIKSGAYDRALRALNHGAKITGQACPLLVPLAEEGWTDGEIATAIAHRYLVQLRDADPSIDTLVLGCTHYPLLAATLGLEAARVFAHPIRLVDSATAMAEVARRELDTRGLRADGTTGALEVFVTDASRMDELAARFLGAPLAAAPSTVDL